MATLCEAYTLCGLLPAGSGIQGLEPNHDTDDDRVIVTDSSRSATVYMVSDQKPLGSWTVKQGQRMTCPVVWNDLTKEYVVVTDEKVIRVWKDEDINLERAFKATVSSEVFRLHSVSRHEPVVLFRRGAVRLLDVLLAAPQQPLEEVLSEEEVIRWSWTEQVEQGLVLLFSTEQRGEHFLYVQRFGPNSLVKHRLETEPGGSAPLSYATSCRNGSFQLLYLFPDGSLYESVLPVRPANPPAEGVQPLPRSLLLQLPVGDGGLESAAVLPLDSAHVAVVGVAHPSGGAGKEYLGVWNTHFQTLQAARELPGRIYGQMWRHSNKLFVCHGKVLSVVPFECQRSSLAAAVGKLKQTSVNENKGPSLVPSWNALLHSDPIHNQEKNRGTANRRSKMSSKNLSHPTLEQLVENIKVGSVDDVQKKVEVFIRGAEQETLQLAVGQLASALVARCRAEPGFYPHKALLQLVETHFLCHSVCPPLLELALENHDFRLGQLCLQLFPDVPEVVTCTFLKIVLSASDSDLKRTDLESDSLQFMRSLIQTTDSSDALQQNGFGPPGLEEESCDAPETPANKSKTPRDPYALDMGCSVGLHKGVLINEILQTPYSENLLLPHLKDLSVPCVILLLQYLRFLYLKFSQDAHSQICALRKPTVTQVMDWFCLLLDAHFTVLVLAPEAKPLLSGLHKFVRSQVKLYSELGKMEGSLEVLTSSKKSEEVGQYSLEVVELF